jgi:FAD/FMN-containing dehydrogenase
MEYVRDMRGSVSAEHGVGIQKPKYLGFSKTPEMIKSMRLVKNAFDPNGIMNPYKVLPDQQ